MSKAYKVMTLMCLVLFVPAAANATQGVRPGDAMRLSGPSPFAECDPALGPASTFYDEAPDTELESSIAINPADPDNIAVAWSQDDWVGVVVAASSDEGTTWARNVVPGLGTCAGGDEERVLHPRLSFGPDGTLYLTGLGQNGFPPDPRSLDSRVPVTTSFDGGFSWTPVTYIDPPHEVSSDIDTIAAEPDQPGAASVVWTSFEAPVAEPSFLSRTTDWGRSWTRTLIRLETPTAIGANRIVAMHDGALVIFFYDEPIEDSTPLGGGTVPLQVIVSFDKGASWSVPVKIADALPEWPNAVATHDGRLYVAARQEAQGGSQSIEVMRSDDHGATWSDPALAATILRPAPPALSGPAPIPGFATANDGTLGLTYYDLRNDVEGDDELTADVFFAHSPDGARWDEERLAGPFDLASIPDRGLGFFHELSAACSFAASFLMGAPAAEHGPTDVFFAPVKVPGVPQRCRSEAPIVRRDGGTPGLAIPTL